MQLIDLTGNKYGKLTVLEKAPTAKNGMTRWLCQCECGNTSVVYGVALKKGSTRSCGCSTYLNRSRGDKRYTLRIYKIWSAMKWRCCNKKSNSYKRYGERGITICDEWKNSFDSFYDWAMANGYKDNLSIDRIDNNGNYEPSNCTWKSCKEQSRNTRRNIKIEYEGETKSLPEWCEILGLPYTRVLGRYKRMRSHGEEIDVSILFHDGKLPNHHSDI